ncbi:MAG: glycoside hydrolase family 38 C-terminal domain-containing protein [Anaerolineae bacterium]|nr:glycosyl hydrolase-related protein [Anaerolineae bacterium]MDW8099008.1 glycoside hydrolase family 38 C-terminal domain-containing protein [Anaerolineae bacterium]
MIQLSAVEPTAFFVRSGDSLQQGVDLILTNDGMAAEAILAVKLGSYQLQMGLGMIQPGTSRRRIYIPDVRETIQAEFMLLAEGQVQDRQTRPWTPERHWEIYLVHGSHHDLGYTDLPSNVLREHARFLDDVLRYCEETADWPEESRFRYVIEQGWSVLHFIEHRPSDTVERLVRLMREGRIEVTALFGNEISELCGHEEQIRLLYPSFRLKRRFGIPIHTAELNDIPGISWGLASVLAGAGIRYFAPAIPDYFAWGFQVHPLWDEEAILPRDMIGAFWWEGPDGQRVLFWYEGGSVHWSLLWTYEQAEREVAYHLTNLAQRGYPYDLLRAKFQGGQRDNSPPDVRLSLIASEWNQRWAYPRLIVATNAQFFKAFERAAGSSLRTLRGDLPNTDYTIGATSTAKETGINRLTHDLLTSAEKLATCATLVSDYVYPADILAEAYDQILLYDEHTWGMAHPIGPAQDACWSQKAEHAYRAAALAHDVLWKSANRLADQIRLTDEGYHIVVFNPLTWERTDVVHLPAVMPAPCSRPMYWRYPPPGDKGPPMWVSGTAIRRDIVNLPPTLLEQPFKLIDLSTGHSVPYQIVNVDDPLAARPYAAYQYALGVTSQLQHKDLLVDPAHRKTLIFVAEDVPPLGYKTYRIVPMTQSPRFESSLIVGEHWLENRFYRITLDPESGAVSSIFDKELQREWVDVEAPYGFNQLVARWPETGEMATPVRSIVYRGESGPVCASLIVKGDAPGCPQRMQEIILYDSVKRIDFANRLLRDATPLLELYFAFPFAITRPRFRYEASNAVIEPIRDQLPGTNTDAYAVQHWVMAWDEASGVIWSSLEAPVVALGGLWPGYLSQAHHAVTPPGYGHAFLRDPAQLEKGHIYSYAMVNNFRTNFQPVQVADVLFRYSIQTQRIAAGQGGQAGEDPSSLAIRARDFGWAMSTPLVPVCVMGPQGAGNRAETGSWLPVTASFCQLDQPNVSVLALKAAEDSDGWIVRLAETEGQEVTVTVTLPFLDIAQAFLTNLVEEDAAVLPYDRHSVRVRMPAHGIVTIRCRTLRQ